MNPNLEALIPLIIQGGIAAALIWVIILLVNGRLHTSSEVDGLRKDKVDLLAANERLSQALQQSNDLLDRLVKER